GVHCPFVMKDEGVYRMWYQGTYWSPNFNRICHAEKTNLYDAWVKDGTVLSNDGAYDSAHAQRPWVLRLDDGTYEMFYSGSDAVSVGRILRATSADGMTWQKEGIAIEPALPMESRSVYYPSVIRNGDDYRMWYSGYDGSHWRIFYAEKAPGYDAQDATCTVSFYVDSASPENLIGSVPNVLVPADGQTSVSIDWIPVAGDHEIIVAVSDVTPTDRDMSNNVAGIQVSVSSPPPAEPAALSIDKVKLSGIDTGITHTYYEWELLITVTNTGGSAAFDVMVKDVLPAELELLEMKASIGNILSAEQPIEGTRATPAPPTTLPMKSTHITWNVGTLEPGQAETLYLKVGTRLNPAGKQEFTSPGIYTINEGAYATGTDSLTGESLITEPAPAITVVIAEQEPVIGLPPAPHPINWNAVMVTKPVNQRW
ncbi:MAG: hypothetical protein R6W91_03345, partial [Thermoplasmata archaeon]